MLGSIAPAPEFGRRPANAGRVPSFVASGVWIVLSSVLPAQAASPPWFDAPYRYVVIDQDVRSILSEFGRNLGTSVTLSDGVEGQVHGAIRGTSAGPFLNDLTAANDLVWYFDGSILHVSAQAEQATRTIPTPGVEAGAVVREVRRLGLDDKRFALRAAPGGNAVTVSGPPAYRTAVEEVARATEPRPVLARDDPRVRVFRGGLPTETVSADTGTAETERR